MKKKLKNEIDLDTSNPEKYVQSLREMFVGKVAQNNTIAHINNQLDQFSNPQNGLVKAANGISIEESMRMLNVTPEQYNDPKNPQYKQNVDQYLQVENSRGQTTPNVNTTNNGYSPRELQLLQYIQNQQKQNTGLIYGQVNRSMSPLAQIFGSIQPGQSRSIPMSGMNTQGEKWNVSDIDQSGLFGRKKTYHINWDGQQVENTPTNNSPAVNTMTSSNVSADPNIVSPQVDVDGNVVSSNHTLANVFLNSRIRPLQRIGSRMLPFDPNTPNDTSEVNVNGNLNVQGIYEKTPINNIPSDIPSPDEYMIQQADRQAQQYQDYLLNRANGGDVNYPTDITIKDPLNINWQQLGQGVMGVANNATSFLNKFNTGIKREDMFNNYAVENLVGNDIPLESGRQYQGYDMPGLGQYQIPGTSDQSVFANDRGLYHGSKIFENGGSVNLHPTEEEIIAKHLQVAGYTFKKIG